MKREEGYYWVKDPVDLIWMIAEWENKYGWYTCGNEYGIEDDEWAEIGERIECPYVVAVKSNN